VGLRQFLDIGTGIPTVGNTHHVAQAIATESRVLYVDYDHCKSGWTHERRADLAAWPHDARVVTDSSDGPDSGTGPGIKQTAWAPLGDSRTEAHPKIRFLLLSDGD
jgi:hypothetical protein